MYKSQNNFTPYWDPKRPMTRNQGQKYASSNTVAELKNHWMVKNLKNSHRSGGGIDYWPSFENNQYNDTENTEIINISAI